MEEVVIIAAYRSAIASFGGALTPVSTRDLGAQVLRESVARCGVNSDDVGIAYIGNVLSAGLGQNVARQICMDAGLPAAMPAISINQVCGSSLQSVMLGMKDIMIGEAQLVIAGGVEHMSHAPYILPQERWGARMGHAKVIDTMISDGLWDAFFDYHMGVTAENIATRWQISREDQDNFALRSQQKASSAQSQGLFKEEIVPIALPSKKTANHVPSEPIFFEEDEYIRKDISIERLAKLRPVFDKEGSVTAGNSSGINDGAAMILLANKSYAQKNKLAILAEIKGSNSMGLDPEIMGFGPAKSIKAMRDRYDIDMDSVDRFEINEAFAAQAIAVNKDLLIPEEKINKRGGAIALGHPIGASGARILCTLLHGMIQDKEHKGIASLCVGGGMGNSIYIERA